MFGVFNGPVLFQAIPAVNRPWQEGWVTDAVVAAWAVFLIAGIWLWARSGRSKAVKQVPFDHTAESFAGEVYAGYGPVPLFLVVIYGVVLTSMVIYTIVSLVNGVQY